MKHPAITTAVVLITLVVCDISSAKQPSYRRNPFAPLDESTGSTAKRQRRWFISKEVGLRLNGIIWNKDNPVAIINDTVVKVGSEIFDRKVSAILPDHVELEYRGKKEVLKIIPRIVFSVTYKKTDVKTKLKKGP